MRLKSKYRQAFRDGGKVDELPLEPPVAPISAAPEVPADHPPAEPPQPAPPASDDATAALRAQIDGLRQSESLRQQQQQQIHDAMHAAKGRRDAWLESTPGAKQNIEALGHFHHAAIHGGLIDASPEYFRFLEDQLAALRQPTEAHETDPAMQETPEFFAPPPAPRPSRVAYSAPVSRGVPSSNGRRQSPGKVTLTPAEVEAAHTAGVSIEEYAKQLLKYREALADGSYRDNREQR